MVESMWKDLHREWARVEGAEVPTWRKGCSMLDAYIEEFEPKRYKFIVHDAAMAVVHEQEMGVASFDSAVSEGNKLIFEFLCVGVEMLGNFRISLDRPANEVRFKHLVSHGDHLYGLDEAGEVFEAREYGNKIDGWTKRSMVRDE